MHIFLPNTDRQPLTDFLWWALSRSQPKTDPSWGGAVNSAIGKVLDIIYSDVSAMKPEICASERFICGLASELAYNAPLLAAVLYRVERAIFLENAEHPVLSRLAHLMRVTSGAEIYYSTHIGPFLNIQHGVGVVIGPRNTIGERLTIHQGVTVGQRRLGSSGDRAVIGDNVSLFAGAKILGSVQVGNSASIAANAVLLSDAEPNSTYAGMPARRVS